MRHSSPRRERCKPGKVFRATPLTAIDIYCTKAHDGSLELSTIHNGRRVHHRYFGYPKREAFRLFRQFVRDQE